MFEKTKKYYLLILLLIIAINSTAQATDTYTAVASYFAECDKVLEEITSDAQNVTSLSGTEKMFKNKVDQMPAFEYLMRTNSKGKIIAKVTRDGIQPRDFRFIGKQQWYEVITMTIKPYYGMMKNRKDYSLFWNKPIAIKGRSGVRFGGSISAKINLKQAFKDISEKEMAEFTVKLGRKTIFSNLKDDGARHARRPLSINGLPVLTIIYSEYADGRKESAPAASFSVAENKATALKTTTKSGSEEKASKVSSDNKEKAKENKVSEKAPVNKDVKKEIDSKPKKVTAEKDEKSAKGSMVILIVIFLAAVVGVIVAIVLIMQNAQKKRKALLEAIDKGEI